MKSKKQLIVVGDRILIKPDTAKDKTRSGLYLPQGVETKEDVQSGYVFKVGPGYPLPDPGASEEPWDKHRSEPKYLPLQAEEGDYALFLRKTAVEIEFENEKYLLVPQAAILLLVRDDILTSFSDEE
ncbi:MAG: co-chaperone GroES [Calditrichaeota bacterium]|nr:MAG: co-chaperone GroES [Calditrichota bacterium]MBL1204788.1 co-chaperone GroES [Calditrichota bacterium]NOG44617.1 co-chaperone GroES [Calditrichota bacterium]